MTEVIFLFIGIGLGAAMMWCYLTRHRLIRTEREWYSDPIIQEWYPEDALRYFVEEDEDLEDWTETMLHGPRF